MKYEKSVSLIATYTYIIAFYGMTKQGNGSSPFPRKSEICSLFLASVGRLTPVSLAVRQAKEKCFFRWKHKCVVVNRVNSLILASSVTIDTHLLWSGYATMLINFSMSLVFVYVTVLSISTFLKAGLFCDAFFLYKFTIIFSRCSASTTKSIMISVLW